MKPLLPFALATTLVIGTATAAEWQDLFNGRDIDGWIKRGGNASYAVEDGAIVGTSTLNTANTFLCTPRVYSDFVLEYEFQVDPKLNSGVQIRSQSFPEATEIEWEGKKIKVPANRVHGYQIEIDPEPAKDRWWSAGIFEEAVRGWLYPGIRGGDAKAQHDRPIGHFVHEQHHPAGEGEARKRPDQRPDIRRQDVIVVVLGTGHGRFRPLILKEISLALRTRLARGPVASRQFAQRSGCGGRCNSA